MNKPTISPEAKLRMKRFVQEVEALQLRFGVTIHCDDTLVIRDDRRTEDWKTADGDVYGQWDAFFFGTDETYPFLSSDELVFEDFDGWEK